MKINEIERQIASQHSAMQAFPSQTPSLEQMFSGQNQRAALEMQIELTKLSAAHDKKLEKMNEVLNTLVTWAEQHQAALRHNEKVEEQRSRENTRLSRIAAWSGVISAILAVVAIIAQQALK